MSEFKRDDDEQGERWQRQSIVKRGRFHLVSFRRPVERLKARVKRLFRGDNLSRLVNTFIRNLEPFLVYHINLDRNYRLLKKMHEVGGAERIRGRPDRVIPLVWRCFCGV